MDGRVSLGEPLRTCTDQCPPSQTASPTQLLTVTTFLLTGHSTQASFPSPPPRGGVLLFPFYKDKETETRVVRSMAGKLEESDPLQDQRGALTSHLQPVKWCSKADLAVPFSDGAP